MANTLTKKTIITLLFVALSTLLFSQDIFNDKLSSDELQKLENGEILIRNIGKAKNMCLNPATEGTEKVVEMIEDLKPAYLAEVIQIRPYEGNEDLLNKVKPILLDIEGYVGIPYYSERNEQYYDLYSSAEILSEDIRETDGELSANLYMNPFGSIDVDISFEQTETDLFYLMANTSVVEYSGFNVVKKDNMQSIVYIFKHNDSLILYGVGGVDAMSIFFLRDRIETSFINRIKTFCQFVFEKI